MGARKLTGEEYEALTEPPLYAHTSPICRTCGHVTYPASWCECDPRRQIEDQLIAESEEHGVLLRPHDDDELLEMSP